MNWFAVGIAGAVGVAAIGALVGIVRAFARRRHARSRSAPLVIDDTRRAQLRQIAETDYSRFTEKRRNGIR